MQINRAAVCLDLGLAGAADKAQSATLPLQVGPGAHKAGALIVQGCHFDLQHALAGGSAVAENLEDQAGAVQQFDPPCLFKVALLHGRDGTVHQHQLDLFCLEPRAQLFDLAFAEQHARVHLGQRHGQMAHHFKMPQRMGQRHGFGQRQVGAAPVAVGFYIWVQHKGPRETGPFAFVHLKRRFAQEASSPSYKLIGVLGMIVEMACLYTSCD